MFKVFVYPGLPHALDMEILLVVREGMCLKRRPKNEDRRPCGLKRRASGLKQRPCGPKRRPTGLKRGPTGLKRRHSGLKRMSVVSPTSRFVYIEVVSPTRPSRFAYTV